MLVPLARPWAEDRTLAVLDHERRSDEIAAAVGRGTSRTRHAPVGLRRAGVVVEVAPLRYAHVADGMPPDGGPWPRPFNSIQEA